jgi:hypothetical protein
MAWAQNVVVHRQAADKFFLYILSLNITLSLYTEFAFILLNIYILSSPFHSQKITYNYLM